MAADKTSGKKEKKLKVKNADAKLSTSVSAENRKKEVQAVAEVVEDAENRADGKQKRKLAVQFFDDDEDTVPAAPAKKAKVTEAKSTPPEQIKQKKRSASEQKKVEVPVEDAKPKNRKAKTKNATTSVPESTPSTSEKKIPKNAGKGAPSKSSLISSIKPAIKKPDSQSKQFKKPKPKEPSPSSEAEEAEEVVLGEESQEEEAGSDQEVEEETELHGFSTDEDDSSDEEMNFDAAPLDIRKLPTIAKDDATVKRKLEKAMAKPSEERGVISISRLPHGFYEDQLKAYFSQFGNVARLRISRNKRTGKSKHYGFVEFDSASVAQIVAETMDNYLMMGHLLQCKVIPKDKVHPELWVGANRKWRAVPHDRLSRLQHNKPRTDEEKERVAKRLIKRQNEQKRKLVAVGIRYDFEPVGYKIVQA